MDATQKTSPAGRRFSFVGDPPARTRVLFPRDPFNKLTVTILLIGLGVVALGWAWFMGFLGLGEKVFGFSIPYYFGAGAAAVGISLAMMLGRHEMSVDGAELRNYTNLFGWKILATSIPLDQIESLRAEEEGKEHYIRIYSTSGERMHVEDFSSEEERDWFVSEVETLLGRYSPR